MLHNKQAGGQAALEYGSTQVNCGTKRLWHHINPAPSFLSLPHPSCRLQHVKILQFNIVLGLCGLAVLFRAAAMPAIGGRAGLSLSDATGDVLAIIATVALGIFSLM